MAVIDENENVQMSYLKPEQDGEIRERALCANPMTHSTTIFRRVLGERIGFYDESLAGYQDWDLWLKIAAELPVEFVSEPLVLYRQSSSGCLTRDMKATDRLREMELVVERGLRTRPVTSATRRRAQSSLDLQWAANWLQERNQRRAVSRSLRAIRARPGCGHAYRLLAYSLLPGGSRDWLKHRLGKA